MQDIKGDITLLALALLFLLLAFTVRLFTMLPLLVRLG